MDREAFKENQAGASGLTSTPTGPVQKPDDSIGDSAQLEAKRLATLAARIALLGDELHELRSGGLLVRAGPAARHFDNLKECCEFYSLVEGRA